MHQWEVRWRTPAHAVVTLDDIHHLPLAERPAVVLPIRPDATAACAEISSLAKTFPGIVLSIDGTAPNDPYTSRILTYARRGFAIVEDNRNHRTTFSVKIEREWSAQQAFQFLTRVNQTVTRGGIIEHFFPDDLPARIVAGCAPDAALWTSVADAYHSNGNVRLYTRITPETRAVNKVIELSDGIVLEPGTQAPLGINAWWRGTVTKTTYGGER